MYFNDMPFITYSLDNETQQIVRDITLRVKISDHLKEAAYAYEKYIIQDGDRPETVASRIYKNPELHWVIMIANDIVDPYEDWPMSSADLDEYIEALGDGEDIDHYENADGYWVNSNSPDATPVTIREYRTKVNDEKRVIKIPKPELINFVISEYTRLMKV